MIAYGVFVACATFEYEGRIPDKVFNQPKTILQQKSNLYEDKKVSEVKNYA